MIPQPTQNELATCKSQLTDFLALKFIDQSLILGFTTVIQSKFHRWIVTDIEEFHTLFAEASDIKQVDTAHCNSIELLRILWTDFHYPIVKSFQRQHAELYGLSLQSIKSAKKSFKVVEMRKLHESFNKYVKSVKSFYTSVMTDIATKYANPLVPQKYLQEFDIVIPSAKEEVGYTDFHSTLSYVTFLCLIGLGNVTRNWAQIRLSYVQPCKSKSAHYKHMHQTDADKARGKQHYIFPLLCYSKCVGLLPTMHEPYNHIGVIYNSLGQKFSAILWFLRSQFTRDVNIAVGRRNLVSALTKPWLEEAYDKSIRKSPEAIEPADANIVLLRIIADYFYPSSFRKSLYREKVESDFLNIMFSETYHERFVKNTNVIAEHLTVFICFYEFALEAQQTVTRDKFGSFLARYIAAYLSTAKNQAFQATDSETPLNNIRLILAFVRKNKEFAKLGGPRFVASLVDAFNALYAFDGEETKSRIVEAFVDGKAPIRSHYFSEDIHFKDFTPIGCQFKDFDDNHLFGSGNINLLFGTFFYESTQGVPQFLDNEAVVRINKEVELASGDTAVREKAIAAECSRCENVLRLTACVVLAKRIFGTRIHLDSEGERFEVETLNVPKTQTIVAESSSWKKAKGKQAEKMRPQRTLESKKKNGQQEDASASGNGETRKLVLQVPATVPSSFEEISSMILGHAPKIMSKGHDSDRDAGLADMVSAIVSEDESRETLTTAGDGMQNLSNDGLTKSTESSRVETGQFTAPGQLTIPSIDQMYPGRHMLHGDSPHGAGFDTSMYKSPQVSQSPDLHMAHGPPNQASFMQQQQQQQHQWFMGQNSNQHYPGAPYGSNVYPMNAFPLAGMPQPSGAFYPGMSQYPPAQGMAPVPGNPYGTLPPPFMMGQFPPNAANQNPHSTSSPYNYATSQMYPQYSNQQG
ncbi:hypothetical protein OY671_003291 [Metschnikowia pulcherrima]|nr:hypothetical protein OY671_003291 [Metschnikowia pulcherrima]